MSSLNAQLNYLHNKKHLILVHDLLTIMRTMYYRASEQKRVIKTDFLPIQVREE